MLWRKKFEFLFCVLFVKFVEGLRLVQHNLHLFFDVSELAIKFNCHWVWFLFILLSLYIDVEGFCEGRVYIEMFERSLICWTHWAIIVLPSQSVWAVSAFWSFIFLFKNNTKGSNEPIEGSTKKKKLNWNKLLSSLKRPVPKRNGTCL